MIEESLEGFMSRWRAHAATVELFPHTEGCPLLECRAGEALIQLFERTGPYLAHPGPAKVIVHPITDELILQEPGATLSKLEVLSVSRVSASGAVIDRDGPVLVVEAAGVPLVVAALHLPEGEISVGSYVTFTSQAPVHGFVISSERPRHSPPSPEHHDEAI